MVTWSPFKRYEEEETSSAFLLFFLCWRVSNDIFGSWSHGCLLESTWSSWMVSWNLLGVVLVVS